jgi:predicted alpha/beta hydrolase family esterase
MTLSTDRDAQDGVHVLVVSGLSPVESDPWQAWLEDRLPRATWIRPLDGDWPDLDRWSVRIDLALAIDRSRPWLVVAHGFGALAVVRHATHGALGPAAAMLVAPADPARFGQDGASLGHPMTYPASTIVLQDGPHEASPWLQDAPARHWARRWHTRLVDAGRGPSRSPLPWVEGEALLAAHLQALRGSRGASPAVVESWAPETTRAYPSAHRFVGAERRPS